MKKAVEALRHELATIRTGRATPALVDHLTVDYQGMPTPLKQLASITAPEARLIAIQPWDRSSISEIERSILKSGLGLNPSNDGTVIRLPIPALSEERRRELVRVVKKRVEEAHIAIRNVRRDAQDRLRAKEKAKEFSQDEGKRAQGQLQRLTDGYILQSTELGKAKEQEVLEV